MANEYGKESIWLLRTYSSLFNPTGDIYKRLKKKNLIALMIAGSRVIEKAAWERLKTTKTSTAKPIPIFFHKEIPGRERIVIIDGSERGR